MFRGKTRDKVCAGLRSIGVDARMVEQGAFQEGVGGYESLGLIEIHGEPIHWVNVLMVQRGTGGPQGAEPSHFLNVYLVPDSSLPKKGAFRAGSTLVKTGRVFKKVIGIRWEGKLPGDLVSRMNGDEWLNQTLIRLKQDIEIRSHPGYSCWAISSNTYIGTRELSACPSSELWDCYKAIARYLLQ